MTGRELFEQAGEELAKTRVREALECYHLAEEAGHNPDECAARRWTCHMLTGDFELAWRESDNIERRAQPDPHRFWDGRSFTGHSVLLRCLHGLGDTLQFIRYAPLVRREARMFTIEAQPKLKPLLQQAGIADSVITWGETEPPWDQQVEVMELPRIFRATLESIPKDVPYIDVSSERPVDEDEARPFTVGVCWASSVYNPARSLPVECMARLFDTHGVAFVSLQAGFEGAQILPWAHQVKIPSEEFTTILETAKTLKQLDLVITVDTMTAHLAGAMGRPVWTLLPYECDWRWMVKRPDSPWYPTMRLFRQPEPDNWDAVIQAVRRELAECAQGRSPYRAALSGAATLVPAP